MARKKPEESRDDYVNRKVAHMNRMGIPAVIYRGAACPVWLKEQLEKDENK